MWGINLRLGFERLGDYSILLYHIYFILKIIMLIMQTRRHNSIWVRIVFECPELMSEIINKIKNKIRLGRYRLAYRLLAES